MNPLDAQRAMLDQLEVLAQRDSAREKALEEALRLNQGRNVAIVQIMSQIDEHAGRLRRVGEDGPDGEFVPREMTPLELERLSGVNDALAYLRAEERASQNALLMGAGRLEELQAIQGHNREEAKRVASRITAMLQEVARGVPHDMVGRPQAEGEVMRDIVSRKAEAKTVARKKAATRKSRS